ncbi:MAG: polyribonucleotide nucleotidyltransferase [Calditrichaeota bacterium]|nr:MAG: polyribonucleotide nucleotidyltransferase [Calditrichota bacterium]
MIQKTIEIDGKTITLETGKLAKQAHGAVVVKLNETVVLVTAVSSEDSGYDPGFFPLSVDYREKFYATGRIPGGFFKREGRPTEKEILSARLIDRPIRPLFPPHYRNETQIMAMVLSMDKENDADVLAGLGASAALSISDIPFYGPTATVRVARVDGKYIIYPSMEEMEKADIELVVAGSASSIMMVEGESQEVSEKDLLEAINTAHEAIKKLVAVIEEMKGEVNEPMRDVEEKTYAEGLHDKVTELGHAGVMEAIRIKEKKARRKALKEVAAKVIEALEEEYPEMEGDIKEILHDIEKDEVRKMILEEGLRLDGRKTDEIRPISCEVDVLPRAHGSALFTRGQTQSLGIVTLGTASDEQIVDAIEGESKKDYMLHYNFPPFSTGEAKPIRGVSRREVGHGNLAERALKPVLPKEGTFPYTIRIVSEILESNGSSSMATVCSGSMALMDAGVPVRDAVAGIAMGLIKEGDKVAILSDILGDEDHLGDMDFKVAGTRNGINAVQMDIKIDGISSEIMEKALEQARVGRLHIMEQMAKAIEQPREDISPHAPKIYEFKIKVDKIGMVIGPGGKTIRHIIEETGVTIDIDEDGTVRIAATESESANRARGMIDKLVEEPELGKAYKGKVKRVKDFGAFVEFLPGKEGMVHISELDIARTNKVTDICNEGDTIDVVVKNIAPDGKIALSRRMFLQKEQKKHEKAH